MPIKVHCTAFTKNIEGLHSSFETVHWIFWWCGRSTAHCSKVEKYVLLLLDEMHVKQDLVYDKSTGQLIGFVNLGEINSHLLALEKCIRSTDPEESTSQSDQSSNTVESQLASTMMVFMVKGLLTRLQFPYAHFPCRDITGDLLFEPFWGKQFLGWKGWDLRCLFIIIVFANSLHTFKVMGATFDGASINRRLVRLHSKHNKEKGIMHKVLNPFSIDARSFFFFSDPPHLIKTTRNCWASKA